MQIGLISDIHDHLEEIDRALTIFTQHNIDMIVNAGDWISLYTFEYFANQCLRNNLKVPIKSVLGNNEVEHHRFIELSKNLPLPIEITAHISLDFVVDEIKIAVSHGHDLVTLRSLISCQSYQLVVTGHTHTVRNELIDKTLVVNPGTLSKSCAGKRLDYYSIAIYNTKTQSAEIIKF